jgi:hypothetical protein
MEIIIGIVENSVEFPQKARKLSDNLTSVYIYKETKMSMLKRYLFSHVHCSIIHNSQDLEAT